jgi:hypothetical protein
MKHLPSHNTLGQPPIELTEEQKFLFDTKGWLLIPSVLSESDIAEMRDFCYRLQRDPQSLPVEERSSVGGPLQRLIDHPVVVGFMNEFVAHHWLATEEGYGFRLDGTFLTIRKQGANNFSPHGGNGIFTFPGNSHTYNCLPGAVNSGLTRVVWELNPVRAGEGGTIFLTGSHKAAFRPPASLEDRHSPLWEEYSCPAGSALFFTEALTHSGAEWTNAEWDRVAVFNCYNTINAKWHKWHPHPELYAAMPPLRQSLVRPAHCEDNIVGERTA